MAVIVTTKRVDFGSVVDKAAQGKTFFELFVIAGSPIVWFIPLPLSFVMVCFAGAQYALAGVAASSATDIQLAALKNKQVK